MLSKKDIKFIRSLKYKKYRKLYSCFLVEGKKIISEFLNSNYEIEKLFFVGSSIFNLNCQFEIDSNSLKKISSLKNPENYLAIFKLKKQQKINNQNLIIALDSIRDPGNLGTIIRTCDWFGVEDIICSNDSVDCYNNKVIQSSMGSVSRVNISYLDLPNYIKSQKKIVAATSLSGSSIYQNKTNMKKGILLFGNESNGISKNLLKLTDLNFKIPRFKNEEYPESLNLASSVAIFLSEIKKLNGKLNL